MFDVSILSANQMEEIRTKTNLISRIILKISWLQATKLFPFSLIFYYHTYNTSETIIFSFRFDRNFKDLW